MLSPTNPKQQVVLQLFAQHSFAANRVQSLQQQCTQQLLRRNRRSSVCGIDPLKLRGHFGQDGIYKTSDCPKGMLFWNSLFERDVAEQLVFFPSLTTHAHHLSQRTTSSYASTSAKSILISAFFSNLLESVTRDATLPY
jgi:hypothetical protein